MLAALLLLHGPPARPHPREDPDLVSLPDPGLRERPRMARAPARPSRDQVPQERQRLPTGERPRARAEIGRWLCQRGLGACPRPLRAAHQPPARRAASADALLLGDVAV